MLDQKNQKLEKILEDIIIHDKSLKSVTGISDEELENMYSIGYGMYEKSQFEKAIKVFNMLCNIDHTNYKYWLAIAACKKMLGQYKSAVKAYALVRIFNPEDAESSIHSAECYIKINSDRQAEECLDDAEALTEIYPKRNNKYKQTISNLRKYLTERNKK